MNEFLVTCRYRGEKDEWTEVVPGATARDALTLLVQRHQNDAQPIVMLRIEDL